AIEVQMVIPRAPILLAHCSECLAAEDLADQCVKISVGGRSLARPRIILAGAKVKRLKFLRAFILEEGIVQFAGTVGAAKEHTERMLHEVRISAEAAADAQSAILLEAAGHTVGGVDQFEGHWPFPNFAVAVGVCVDAGGGIEEVW